MSDMVNHPKHYEGNTSIECIEAMEIAFGTQATCDYCKLNCFKYLWRYKYKNGMEDLEKAQWYYDKAFELSRLLQYEDGQIEVIGRMLNNYKQKGLHRKKVGKNGQV